MYFREADAAVFCYSIDSVASSKQLSYWQENIDLYSDNVIKALVGNKIDLEEDLHVITTD